MSENPSRCLLDQMQKAGSHMANIAHDWVFVCDGGRAIVLENIGDRDFPNLRLKAGHTVDGIRNGDVETAAPGRVHQSRGAARSALEAADHHDQAEREFLVARVKELEEAARAGAFTTVKIAAPPRALGMMRPVYGPYLRERLVAEIPKDLVHRPIYEIEKALYGDS
jgi:protein required for attachment to host cells